MRNIRFGLIGHPIEHSLSPALFKAGYDGKYPYDLIQGEDFETSYQRFLQEYDGINVTAPFKEAAYAKADIVSDECRLCKATNLLIKTPDGIKAHNSDFLGVRLWLQDVSEKVSCPTVLIVGTGGAGRAAAAAAASLGMDTILMNRNPERAEKLAEDLKGTGHDVRTGLMKDLRECFLEADVMIYSIPTAIPELNTLADSRFTPDQAKFILEANYKDPSFKEDFIKDMRMVRYTGGRTWLLYQALTGYEIFTGEKPDLEKMSAVL